MINKKKSPIAYGVLIWAWSSLFCFLMSCSTTKQLSQDEVLYVGVKKMEINKHLTLKYLEFLKLMQQIQK